MTARATASMRARSRGDAASQRASFSDRTRSTMSSPWRRSGRGDDDVGSLQPRRQVLEGDDLAAEARGDRARAVGAAVGEEHRADALLVQRAGGQLARLARADDRHLALAQVAEQIARQV